MINWRSLHLLTCLRVGLPFCGFSWAAAFPPSGHLFEWEAVVMWTSSWHWPLSSSPIKSQEKSKEAVSWQRRLDPNSTPPLPLHLQCPLYCGKEGDGELRFAGGGIKAVSPACRAFLFYVLRNLSIGNFTYLSIRKQWKSASHKVSGNLCQWDKLSMLCL